MYYEGKADEGVAELVRLIGEEWEEELKKLKDEGYRKLDAEKKATSAPNESKDAKEEKESRKEAKDNKAADKKDTDDKLVNPTIKDDSSKLDELTHDLETKAKLDDSPTNTDPEAGEAKKSSS